MSQGLKSQRHILEMAESSLSSTSLILDHVTCSKLGIFSPCVPILGDFFDF